MPLEFPSHDGPDFTVGVIWGWCNPSSALRPTYKLLAEACMCWLIFHPRNETVSPLLLPGFLFFRINFSFLSLKLDYHNLTVLKFQMSFLFLTNEQDSLQFKIEGGSFSSIVLGVSRQHLLIIGLLESNLINKGRIWRSTVVHCWWEYNFWIVLRNVNWYSLLEGNLNLQGISVRIKKAWTL